MIRPFLFFFFFNLSFSLFGQQSSIEGRIIDADGRPVPFASVFVKNHNISAIANENGLYKIVLQPERYTLVVGVLGYKPRQVIVLLQSSAILNIEIEQETYFLNEVIINSAKEDPAYEIIRKVITRRKLLRDEAADYVCDVYTKGVQKLISVPAKILGRKVSNLFALDSNGQAILYQSETRSKIYSVATKKKELMVASKVAGDNQGFSFNSALDLQVDFYNNLLHWDALGKSSFVSPVADDAIHFYEYKLLGESEREGKIVYKIQVNPDHLHSPGFRGNIFVLKDEWRLYSVDLYLTADARINFVDTLKITQNFSEISKGIWKQSDITFKFNGRVLGFDFAGYVNGLNSNYDLKVPATEYFSRNEIMKVPADVNRKDNTYWTLNRPMPLTLNERVNYLTKDSIDAKRQSREYLDSIQRLRNKFRLIPFILVGQQAENIFRNSSWYIYPFHNIVFYNTVEGWGLNLRARYTKQYNFRRSLTFEPNVRYGFARKSLNMNALVTYQYDTLHHASISLKGGTDFLDLNNRGTLNLFYNTLTTLFDGHNYLKLYRSKFISIRTQREIIDGLQITAGAEIAVRYPVNNASNRLIFDNAAKVLTSNNPLIPDKDENLFPINNAFIIEGKVSYTFGQRYISRPDGKIYQTPRYPTIQFDYRKGIKNVFNSVVDYDFMSADISQDKIYMGLMGRSSFYVSAGMFSRKKSLYYSDIHHFTGNQTAIYNPIFPNFHFLDYYAYSTSGKYFEAHYEHNFAGLFIRKLPVIRNLKLEEVIGGAFLTLPNRTNYKEAYVGLQRLVFRFDYGYSWVPGQKPRPAFRLFYGF